MPQEFKIKNGVIVDQGGANITGSSFISGSLAINASGSNVFTVDGTAGRLFSVDDSLSGSLFSVNTIAGLPIIEAFSDNTVRIGKYGQKGLFVSQSYIGIGTEVPIHTLDVSGSARITSSVFLPGLTTTSQTNVVTVDTATGQLYYTASSAFGGSSLIGGSTNYVARWASSTTLTTGSIFDDGTNVGIGTTTLGYKLDVNGATNTAGSYYSNGVEIIASDGSANYIKTGTSLYFQAGSTVLNVMANNGDFGLNTTSPVAKLDVNGTAVAKLFGGSGSIPNYGQFEAYISGGHPTYGSNYAYYSLHRGGSTDWQLGMTGSTFIIANGGGDSQYTLWNNKYFAIDTNGKVGIGTTTPSSLLTVAGNISSSAAVYFKGLTTANQSNVVTIDTTTGQLYYTASSAIGGDGSLTGGSTNYVARWASSTTLTTGSIYDNGTNVGIFTATPTGSVASNLVHIAGNNAVLRVGPLYSPDDRDFIELKANGSDTKVTSPNERFWIENTSGAIIISASSGVGIGTTSPTQLLEVVGSGAAKAIKITTLTDHATFFEAHTNSGSVSNKVVRLQAQNLPFVGTMTDHTFDIVRNNTPIISLSGSNVGIGTTSPSYKLDVSGSARITSSVFLPGLTTTSQTNVVTVNTATGQLYYTASSAIGGGGSGLSGGSTNYVARWASSTTLTTGSIYDNGTNVGIGTTSPANKLHVSGGRIIVDDILANQSAIQFNSNGTEMAVLYRPATTNTQIRLYTTIGGDIMTWTGSNVGIGTTSPNSLLDINGAAVAKFFGGSGSVPAFGQIESYMSSTEPTYGNNYAYFSLHRGGQSAFQLGMTGSTFVIAQGGGGGQFSLFADKYFSITSAGLVGIGTTTPGYKLDVNGTFGTNGDATFNGTNTYINSSNIAVGNNSTDVVGISGNTMYFPGDGKVGIGTTSPLVKLQVVGNILTGGSTANIDGVNLDYITGSTGYMLMGWNRSSGEGESDFISNRGAGTSGGFAWYDISNSGTQTRLLKLDSAGAATFGSYVQTSTLGLYVGGSNTSVVSDGSSLYLKASGNTYLNTAASAYITSTGYAYMSGSTINFKALTTTNQSNVVTIDTATGQLYYTASSAFGGGGGASLSGGKTNYNTIWSSTTTVSTGSVYQYSSTQLQLTGSSLAVGNIIPSTTSGRIDASNDIVAYSSSDKRFKTNITLITNALEKITQIGGYEFDWIENSEHHGFKGHDVGVIAQEIEAILPEVVSTRDSGYKAVKYEKIVPLLIESIKEQQQQINNLQQQINKLINGN